MAVRRGLCVLLLVLCRSYTASASGKQVADEQNCRPIAYRLASYESGGKQLSVEVYEPVGNGKFPVVLFIHGAGGVITRAKANGIPAKDNFGEKQAACNGYIAVLPHYFDSSGHVSVLDRSVMEKSSRLWLDTLKDSITYAQSLEKADSSRIFLYGESLGGYLAISLASTDPRVRAVSVFGSGLPPGVSLRALPPTLIQYGEIDDVVSSAESKVLAEALNSDHVSCRVIAYPKVGHYPSAGVQKQLLEQTLGFFKNK